MGLLLQPREALDAGLLARAAAAVEAHHDALRLRFRQEEDGHWTQWHAEPSAHGPLVAFDLSGLPAGAQREAIEAGAEQVQRSLDLSRGPLLRMGWFQMGGEDAGRLLAVAHHLVVDAVSWRVLLEDLETAYTELAGGESVRLPARTTAWKTWAERLAEHARSEAQAAEGEYWLAQARQVVAPVPTDDPGAESTLAQVRSVTIRLTEEETGALLREVPAAYRTHIDEVLLAALAGAMGRWTGQRRVRVDLEGHGREEDLLPGVDLSRTAGWFTNVYPTVLELPGGDDVGAALKAVKEQMRAVPHRGMGYGLLRWLSGSEAGAELAAAPGAEVSFNYLGQLDQAVSADTFFRFAPESAGAPVDRRTPHPYRLGVGGSVQAGRLELRIAYVAGVHRRETVERLAEWYTEELRAVIEHCRSEDAGGYTPSDFPLARLDQAALDTLLGSERGVEDVYPLSPLQEGMLFHALYAPGSGVYVTQFGFALEGALDSDALERAWQAAVERHEPLRTGFAWEGLPRPVQVVRREAELPFRREDWRGLDAAEQKARLERFLDADRAEGFELARAPLMRMALFRTGEEAHELVWTHNHIILDGWSLSLVFRDVVAAYTAHARGVAPQFAPARRYRAYVAWLENRDRGSAERFWRQALAGFSAATRLPGAHTVRGVSDQRGQGVVKLAVPAERTRVLQDQARVWGVTMSTLVQGAWGLLLGRYAGEDDVVFGAIASGRPAELPGVEETVGLFINTLPVRVRLPGDTLLQEWLAELQKEQVEAREHEYAPLRSVQRWSELPTGESLFDSLVVFENYPVDQAVGEAAGKLDGLRVRPSGAREQANYPLVLSAQAAAQLWGEIRYDGARVEAEAAERLAGHLEVVLEAIATHPASRLSELSLLRRAERAQVLQAWNATAAELPRACVHELFAEQAARTPGATAIVDGEATVTYAELEGRANRLARLLRRRGVGPEVRVGMVLERGTDAVLAMLGILMAGGAYVPLAPSNPAERLHEVFADAGVSLVLTNAAAGAQLPGEVESLWLDDAQTVAALAALPDTAPEVESHPGQLAYVIYTSGSTGRPKGVAVAHASIVRLVRETNYVPFGPEERIAHASNLAFDAATFEIWGALLNGGSLAVIERELALSPADFAAALREREVSALFLTTALFNRIAADEPEAFARLRHLLFGGEAV
ncbi:MAG: condensation domain-containing protein, partial [Longimicrobiaceae bacterium]